MHSTESMNLINIIKNNEKLIRDNKRVLMELEGVEIVY